MKRRGKTPPFFIQGCFSAGSVRGSVTGDRSVTAASNSTSSVQSAIVAIIGNAVPEIRPRTARERKAEVRMTMPRKP